MASPADGVPGSTQELPTPPALERIDRLHQSLTGLVLEGAGLDVLAEEMSLALGIGIVVTTIDGRERGAAVDERVRRALAAADLVDPTGRFRVERLRGPDSTGVPFGDGEIRLVQLSAAGTDLVRLVCISPVRRLDADDLRALQRAATVVALVVSQQQAVAAVENKYRGDFLRDVFLARAGGEDFVVEHARGFGWDLDRPVVVVSAEVDPLEPDEEPVPASVRRTWQERFSAAWRQVCEAHDRSIPTADFSTEVVALLPIPRAGSPDDDHRQLRIAVDRVVGAVAGDRGGGRRPFSVGVSRAVERVEELPAAYRQARRATEVGRRMTGGKSTTWFDDLGLHRLIALVTDEEELQQFATDVLGPLAEDGPEASNLRMTLQILLDTNFNVAEAARLQFFHYNTMRYRVTKLERLLGPFTSDPHLRLNVAVALQVLDFRR